MARKLYGQGRPGLWVGKRAPGRQNYTAKVLQVASENQTPGVGIIDVLHDEGCSFWQGRNCDCDPIVTRRVLQ